MFVLFIFFVIVHAVKKVLGIIKNFRTFYKDIWMIFDIVIISMSILSITMWAIRQVLVEEYLDEIEKVNHNIFIPYFSLFYFDDAMSVFAAILVCVATIRLWKFLRFGKIFRIMERTLSLASGPLASVTLAFGVILMGFGLSGILLLGNEFPDFSFIIPIVRTLITLCLKPDQFDIRVFLVEDISYAYFSGYLMLMQIIMLLYITVIVMAYVKAQLESSEEDEDTLTVQSYFTGQYEYFREKINIRFERQRLQGGAQERTMIHPKADEFRYANCVSVQSSALNDIELVTKCVIKNIMKSENDRRRLSESNADLMRRICLELVFKKQEGDDVELFYKGHFAGQSVTLIDEKRIILMEQVVSKLLKQSGEGASVRRLSLGYDYERCVEMIRRHDKTLKKSFFILSLIRQKVGNIEDKVERLC